MIQVPVASSSLGDTAPAGFDWGNLAEIIGSSAKAATQVILATRDPLRVPGTEVIYTPATGQLQTAAGVTATGVGWGLTPMVILGALGLVLVVVLMKPR